MFVNHSFFFFWWWYLSFFPFFNFFFSLLVCTVQPGGILNLSKSIKHHLLNSMHFAIWINHSFPNLCLACSVASVMSDSATLRTVACQVPLPMARILAVGCHFLQQGIFSTQGLNHHLLYCSWIVYHWATLGLDIKLFWSEGKKLSASYNPTALTGKLASASECLSYALDSERWTTVHTENKNLFEYLPN